MEQKEVKEQEDVNRRYTRRYKIGNAYIDIGNDLIDGEIINEYKTEVDNIISYLRQYLKKTNDSTALKDLLKDMYLSYDPLKYLK